MSRLDPLGTVVFITSVICLPFVLQWGGSKYNWNSACIKILFVISGIDIFVWISIQIWKGKNTMVSKRVMKQRSIIFALLNSFCIGGTLFIVIYYVSIWFQAIKGVSEVQSDINPLLMLLGVAISDFLPPLQSTDLATIRLL